MNQEMLEQLAQTPFSPQTALISITSHNEPFAQLQHQPEYLLQLKFNDVPTVECFAESVTHNPDSQAKARIQKTFHPMSEQQAKEIVDFYHSVKYTAQLLICQCEDGTAISTAIAAAFLEYEFRNGITIFSNDEYFPNKSIFRKICRLLKEYEK